MLSYLWSVWSDRSNLFSSTPPNIRVNNSNSSEFDSASMSESSNSTPKTQQIHQLETGYTATWRVNNFRSLQYQVGQFIESDTFTTNIGDTKQVWLLRMYPNGYKTEYQESFLYLYCKSECTVSYKFAILDRTNTEQCVKIAPNRVCNSGNWVYGQFVKRDELFEENSKLLVNGALTVLCVITKYKLIQPKGVPARVVRPTDQLSKDFGDLLKSSRLSDLTITVGEREFHVHRAILAARSPVFSAMFEHNLKENNSGRLDISDIDFKTMEVLLNFIYTGDRSGVKEVAEDLLRASDKYQLDELKVICSNDLFIRITSDNASLLLASADLYNASQLKVDVLEFVINNFKALTISEGWKTLSAINPSLTAEVKDRLIEHYVLNK